jgi:hypothetical protein
MDIHSLMKYCVAFLPHPAAFVTAFKPDSADGHRVASRLRERTERSPA